MEYTESAVFELFKDYIGSPVFAVLGNHDSNPSAIDGLSPTIDFEHTLMCDYTSSS